MEMLFPVYNNWFSDANCPWYSLVNSTFPGFELVYHCSVKQLFNIQYNIIKPYN